MRLFRTVVGVQCTICYAFLWMSEMLVSVCSRSILAGEISKYGSFQCVRPSKRNMLIQPPSGSVGWSKTFFIKGLLGFSTSSIPVPVTKVTLSFFSPLLSLYFSLIFDLAELNERPVQNPFLPESRPCFDCQFKGWVAPRPPLRCRATGPALFGGG